MAATRNNSPGDEGATSTETSGFSEEQRSELEAIITRVVGGAKPSETGPKTAPKLTDSEWDTMTDRGRERHVREIVVEILDSLAAQDDQRQLADKVAALEAEKNKEPEPEQEPGIVTKLQKFIWGEREPSEK